MLGKQSVYDDGVECFLPIDALPESKPVRESEHAKPFFQDAPAAHGVQRNLQDQG